VTQRSICVIQVLVETKVDVSGKREAIPVCANQVLQVTVFIIFVSLKYDVAVSLEAYKMKYFH
jgi:hypothetical protein